MKLTLGFSPCPNDTFIFDAMVNGHIDTKGITFDYVMEDVATLNKWAEEEKSWISPSSVTVHFYIPSINMHYCTVAAPWARGVGPLIIAKEPIPLPELSDCRIAIPGFNTTANLLMSLACPYAVNKHEVIFSEIEEGVLSGQYDAGLIIHESRFTYAQKGLVKLLDLGDWWENTMNAAIPLGGIVIRRSFDKELCATVDAIIKESLAWSWKRYPELTSFITDNAQEMEEDVMRKHIELYVNEYTTDLGTDGRNAINTLFTEGKKSGLVNEELPESIFY